MKTYLIALAAILLAMVIGNSYIMISKDGIADNYAAAHKAIADIKQETTTAHLWVEETISGHQHATFNDFWHSMEKVDAWIDLLAQLHAQDGVGGQGMIDAVGRLRGFIKSFRSTALKRELNAEKSIPDEVSDLELDIEFDAEFKEIIDICGGLDHSLDLSKTEAIAPFRIANITLITLGLLGVMAVFLSIWRAWQKRIHED